jgi:hypothetical protein
VHVSGSQPGVQLDEGGIASQVGIDVIVIHDIVFVI